MDIFLHYSGMTLWVLMGGYIAWIIYWIFIHPFIQALSVTLLSCYASIVNKEVVNYRQFFPAMFRIYIGTFFLSEWRTTSLSCNLYRWDGVFKWTIYRGKAE